jgi:hypothetical protein
VRALVCPESDTEDTVILIRVEGATISFTDDGQFQSILDAAMIYHATPRVAEDQEVGPVALHRRELGRINGAGGMTGR